MPFKVIQGHQCPQWRVMDFLVVNFFASCYGVLQGGGSVSGKFSSRMGRSPHG